MEAKRFFVVMSAVVTLALCGAVKADLIQIQDGLVVDGSVYDGGGHTWIHSGAPDSKLGANGMMRVGTAGDVFRSLARFGALSHWAGVDLGFNAADITAATLTLYKKGGEGSGTVQLHVLGAGDQDWDEGWTSWNKERTDIPLNWDQGPGIGGNYGSLIDSKPFSDATANNTAMTFNLTGAALNVIKDWVSGTNTSGTLFLRAANESTGSNYYDWYSEEQANKSLTPLLTITYVPEPATVLVLGLGALLFRRK